MARKRKGKSIAEAAGGFVMMIVALAILNPVFRGQVISTLWFLFAIAILLGVVVLSVYLVIQLRNSEAGAVKFTDRNPAMLKVVRQSVAADGYIAQEQARIQEVILSVQSANQSQIQFARQDRWDDSVLPAIEWKRFEIVTREYLRMTGYEARETNVGADGGVDIRVSKAGTEGIVQCKAWNTYKVGVKPVRELYGIMAAEKISRGLVITSGGFTAEAEEFAKGTEGKMKLVSGGLFLDLIRKLSADKQQQLLEVATEGDYRTPTCPQCDVKMKVKESKKGRNAGNPFWGCVNFPRCRQTLVYKEG
jgi:HJR/Mrr/RecB family endonuclease